MECGRRSSVNEEEDAGKPVFILAALIGARVTLAALRLVLGLPFPPSGRLRVLLLGGLQTQRQKDKESSLSSPLLSSLWRGAAA